MVQFAPLASPGLCVHPGMIQHDLYQVAPFGNPRIKGCLHLPEAYRSLPRPSSPSCAKASTVRPLQLDQKSACDISGLKVGKTQVYQAEYHKVDLYSIVKELRPNYGGPRWS